jgi:hypothetical protein
MEVNGYLHAPATFPPGETTHNTHSIGGWMGCRAILETLKQK